jgi:hypothetical protein
MTTGRREKFRPDPPTPEAYMQEQINQTRRELRTTNDRLNVPTIHTFDRAKYIDPVQGEIFWDFQFQRGYIYHHERYRPLAPPTYHIKVTSDDRPIITGNNKFVFMISRDMGGYTPDEGDPYPDFYLYDAEAYVSTAGSCTVQIRNVTHGNTMLSTPLTIDSGEYTTRTAAVQRVIDPGNDFVRWADLIAIDITAASGCMGLGVILVFNPELPSA